jgi:hypothetical protein
MTGKRGVLAQSEKRKMPREDGDVRFALTSAGCATGELPVIASAPTQKFHGIEGGRKKA